MRFGLILGGLVGSVVVGVLFWLAVYGLVQLGRPMPVAVGPGVAALPAPLPAALTQPAAAALPGPGQIQAQTPATPTSRASTTQLVAICKKNQPRDWPLFTSNASRS